jgi:hypothetical protein
MASEFESNPYESPAPTGSIGSVSVGASGVSDETIQLLKQTRPWVRLLGILGFIGCVLMILAGIGLCVTMSQQRGAAFGIGMMITYGVMGLLYIFPSIYLLRYAKHIRALEQNRTVPSLNEALTAQKSFWKFVGMMFAIIFVIYGVIFVVMIFAGALGAFSLAVP